MARTLSNAAATAAARPTGTLVRYLVGVEWATGSPVWYGFETITQTGLDGSGNPVEMAISRPLLRAMSPLASEDRLDTIVQHEAFSFSLGDEDRSISSRVDGLDAPGPIGRRVSVYLWLRADDVKPEDDVFEDNRLLLFGGIITKATKRGASRLWDFECRSHEATYEKKAGIRVTSDVFTDIPCNEDGRQIIPIVYGRPVKRVPAVLIDRPGRSTLAAGWEFTDDVLYVTGNADQLGFTTEWENDDGDTVRTGTLVVGQAGRSEVVTGTWGYWDKWNNRTPFTIDNRTAWFASATATRTSRATRVTGASGIWLPPVDLLTGELLLGEDATQPKTGHAVAVKVNGAWYTLLARLWLDRVGGYVVAWLGGVPMQLGQFYEWHMCRWPGFIPRWPAGVEVVEQGAWTYAVSCSPCEDVERVEAVMRQNVYGPSTGQREVWMTFARDDAGNPDTYHWWWRKNDWRWNYRLGLTRSDPGITTVELLQHPAAYGLDPQVYVTLKGTRDEDDDAALAYEKPAEVIQHLLTSRYGGNIDVANLDVDSFTDAQARLDADGRDMRFAFAITEADDVLAIARKLADQATCRLSVQSGKIRLDAMEHIEDATTIGTATQDNTPLDGLAENEVDQHEWPRELVGIVPRFPGDKRPNRITSRADATLLELGEQTKEQTLQAYQSATHAAKAHAWRHQNQLEAQREITATRFLDLVAAAPGDHVAVDIDVDAVPMVTPDEVRLQKTTLAGQTIQTAGVGKAWDVTLTQSIGNNQCDAVLTEYWQNTPLGAFAAGSVGESQVNQTYGFPTEQECLCDILGNWKFYGHSNWPTWKNHRFISTAGTYRTYNVARGNYISEFRARDYALTACRQYNAYLPRNLRRTRLTTATRPADGGFVVGRTYDGDPGPNATGFYTLDGAFFQAFTSTYYVPPFERLSATHGEATLFADAMLRQWKFVAGSQTVATEISRRKISSGIYTTNVNTVGYVTIYEGRTGCELKRKDKYQPIFVAAPSLLADIEPLTFHWPDEEEPPWL